MLDCPLMLGMNLPIVNTIPIQSNKIITAVKIRLKSELTVTSKLSESPGNKTSILPGIQKLNVWKVKLEQNI